MGDHTEGGFPLLVYPRIPALKLELSLIRNCSESTPVISGFLQANRAGNLTECLGNSFLPPSHVFCSAKNSVEQSQALHLLHSACHFEINLHPIWTVKN